MIVKVVQIRDVVIIETELSPCADVFTFRIVNKFLEICGSVYQLSEELEAFRKGLLILRKTPYFFECEEGVCIAAKTHV
ncbi:MAG: hypothetical protein QXK71_07735 [Pyrobaculum sp.]|jgi:hypothetical protein